MLLHEIYNHNVKILYKNTICSKATFFIIITTIIAIISPLIVVYRSRGFWLKNYIFYEQPNVHFKYQYLFVAETDDYDYTIACGNLPKISNYMTNLEECVHAKVFEADYTLDNKVDEIHFSLRINNPLLKNIFSIKLLMILDYKLHGICPLQMESLIVHDKQFNLPTMKYFITANLEIKQSYPLPCWHNIKDIQYNSSVIPKALKDDDWLERILYQYSRRNFSTDLDNIYTIKKHGTASTFILDLAVAIPEHPIRYRPGLWQELKFSWQQYFAVGVIFYWIYVKINNYVFQNNILLSWECIPWKKK